MGLLCRGELQVWFRNITSSVGKVLQDGLEDTSEAVRHWRKIPVARNRQVDDSTSLFRYSFLKLWKKPQFYRAVPRAFSCSQTA